MKNILATFYNDVHTREAVQDYILTVFDNEALKAVYRGEDTAAYKPARDVIKRAFKQMYTDFAVKEEKKPNNRAR